MRQLTISLEDSHEDFVREKVEEGDDFDSKSAVIRDAIDNYERIHVLEDRVEELEQEIERVHNEKRALILQRDENREMKKYIEEKPSYPEGDLRARLKWLIFGSSD